VALMRVEFGFRSETNLVEWRRSHAAGQHPDAVPYGIDRMESPEIEVTTMPLGPLRTGQEISLLFGKPPRAPTPDWSIAWDEHAALRLLARGSGARFGCGVIWATDRLVGSPRERARARLMLRLLRPMDLIWCLSRAQVTPLRAALDGRKTRVEFLKFGVDTDFFTVRPLPAQPSVLSIGNDVDRDTRTLFAALDVVRDARPDAMLRVQYAGDLPVPAGVARLPRMTHPQLREEYAATTVVAIATRQNLHVSGMTAVLEGMATGRPVVLTGTPGAEDYVKHGQWGLLTEPGNVEDLARSILYSLDFGNAARMGAAAAVAAATEYSSARFATRLSELLLTS
jgi:glycosyltransferase involved in cell wall biosynthesis